MKELIEKVRKYPVLYNTSHPDYAKKALKDMIWQEISEELNYIDGEEAKSVWLKLRNCHRDALRRRECLNKSGSTSKRRKTWKYERQMSFLLKYMIRTATSKDTSNQESYQQEQQVKTEENDYMYYAEVENCGVEDAEDNTDTIKNDYEVLLPEVNVNLRKKQKKFNKTTVESIITRTIKKHEEEANIISRQQVNDDLYHFYMSMYGITKTLPLNRQCILKRKIFELVTTEQEELLRRNEAVETAIAEDPMHT